MNRGIGLQNRGGVVLTFDDDYVVNWHRAAKYLESHAWKATFFVSNFESLTTCSIDLLLDLQCCGHEISFHGRSHLSAKDYSKKHSICKYIKDEILISVECMKRHGFNVKFFAYPFGDRTRFLDYYLLKYFDALRGTIYPHQISDKFDCFFTGKRLLYGLGIDESYQNKNLIYEKLNKAHVDGLFAIFYGHDIGFGSFNRNNTTDISTLESMCRYVHDHSMQFLTFSDLYT